MRLQPALQQENKLCSFDRPETERPGSLRSHGLNGCGAATINPTANSRDRNKQRFFCLIFFALKENEVG
jgi:hypothetical protein